MLLETSLLAIVLAGLSNIVLGMTWYSPAFLGKPWMKEVGVSMGQRLSAKDMFTRVFFAVVGSILVAYVLAYVAAMSSALDVGNVFTSAFWVWLGFVLPILLNTVLWEKRTLKLYAINSSYWLVSLMVMALIIHLIG